MTAVLVTQEVAEQAETEMVSAASVMRHPSFLRGVEEYRARKRPNFEDADWNYERGRQWAAIAPRNLKVFTRGRLNRVALLIFQRHIP
jgi:hypothetical protein